MTYRQAVAYLNSLVDWERSPDPRIARQWNLDRMRALLRALGDPHESIEAVHVAGTKGKGSTVTMLASIARVALQARGDPARTTRRSAGRSVGLFTKPHLVCLRERIRLNGRCIPRGEVARLTEKIRPPVERLRRTEPFPPSFFEAHVALAFLYFSQKNPDLVVLETGLGGRLDATNVVTPLVCGITTIGIDHTAELGGTISQIAHEKAGIIKRGVPVVSAPQSRAAARVIADACAKARAPLFGVSLRRGSPPANPRAPRGGIAVWPPSSRSPEGQTFTVRGLDGLYEDLFCPLAGYSQPVNAAVAVGLAELLARQGFPITASHIRAGIESVRWPGRLETVARRPRILLDCAHDGISARALARDIEALFPRGRLFLVLGVSSDKKPRDIARPLCALASRIFLTAAPLPRAMEPEALRRSLAGLRGAFTLEPGVAQALDHARSAAHAHDVILVTGSVYIVGEAMKALRIPAPCSAIL